MSNLATLRPFSSTYQPKNRTKARGPYLTSFLKRCLAKKINMEDPETQKMIKGTVRDALIWRLILNGTQGETQAIKEIFDRVEGKINGNGNGKGNVIIIIKHGYDDSVRLSPLRAEAGNTEQG